MEKSIKKPYVRPVSTCIRVELEGPICSASEYRVGVESQHGINAQEVNQEFSNENNFTDNTNPNMGWDVK